MSEFFSIRELFIFIALSFGIAVAIICAGFSMTWFIEEFCKAVCRLGGMIRRKLRGVNE